MINRYARSIAKAISWQSIGLVTSLGITYAFTGNVMEAGLMTAILTITASVLYVVHEQVWHRMDQRGAQRAAHINASQTHHRQDHWRE